jgi:hypothetical protein
MLNSLFLSKHAGESKYIEICLNFYSLIDFYF